MSQQRTVLSTGWAMTGQSSLPTPLSAFGAMAHLEKSEHTSPKRAIVFMRITWHACAHVHARGGQDGPPPAWCRPSVDQSTPGLHIGFPRQLLTITTITITIALIIIIIIIFFFTQLKFQMHVRSWSLKLFNLHMHFMTLIKNI